MDLKIASIVKALAFAENGGKPDISNPKAGKTGETKSIFQFTPDTWKVYSKQTSGQDNLPMNAQNESQVVYHKVEDWVNQGYNVEQIASMWNAGEQRPDAYKQNWKGTNKKYGVAFDTPAYAKKVADYAHQFQNENNIKSDKNPSRQSNGFVSQTSQIPQKPPVSVTQPKGATLPELMQKQAKTPRSV